MLPHTAQHRRRHLPDPLDADRGGQPRPGADPDEHRLAAVRPAQLRLVDAVRPGQRIGRPARLRRAHQRQGNQRRRQQLRLRLPADDVRRHAVPQRAAIRCCICRTRSGIDRRDAAGFARCAAAAERAGAATTSAIPKSPPASRATRWPIACRPAPRS